MSRSNRYFALFGLPLLVLVGGGLSWRWYATTRADYLLSHGRMAVRHGEWDKVDYFLKQLEDRGYTQPVHLLLGEALLYKGRILLARASGSFDSRLTQPGLTISVPASAVGRAEGLGSPIPVGTRLQSAPQESFRQALKELTQVRSEEPWAADATVLAAECLVRLNERRLAAEALETVISQQPDHKEAHRLLAAIYIDLNSPLKAIEHLGAWGRLDPDQGLPYRWIGFFSKDYQRPAEAVAAYREALNRRLQDADRARVVQELVEVLTLAQGDYEAALGALALWPEGVERPPELIARQAECFLNLTKSEEAARLVDASLRANPDLPQALLLRAQMYLTNNEPKAAVPLLEKAVTLDPHDLKSRQHLMQAYKQLGDSARAEQQRRLLEETKGTKEQLSKLHTEAFANPWNDQIRCQLGALCQRLNRPAEARMWYQAALACNPGSTEARQGLERLAESTGGSARSP
jgi:tetratricopeptide (TPR) repeat protein